MNTVSELKELYKELGGSLTDTYEDIADGAAVGNYNVIPDCIAALAKIAGSTIELPAVSAADNGNILKVVAGKWAKGQETAELPAVTAEDEGDVLTVNAEGAWTKAEPVKELPTVTASDNGSVLSVVDGAWAKDDGSYSIDSVNLATTAGSKTSVPFGEFENEIILQFNNAVLSGAENPVKVSYPYYGSDTELFKIPTTETTFKKVVIIKKIANPNNKNAVIAICGEQGGTFATSIAGTSIPGIDFTVDGSTHFTSGSIAVYRR